MEKELEKIRTQQKESWNLFSSGWKKWDNLTMEFMRPVGDEIIRVLHPAGHQMILDVASGTGEPGLTIASMLKDGKVTLTDLSEDMLTIARENAAKKGIKNIETVVADVCELPFKDGVFDAISCRFGLMFFPDMSVAMKEMVRVLKPGGKIAVSVWNIPEKNFWITALMSAINKNMELPIPPPGSPGIFRCAGSGMIAGLFRQAGLKNITEKEVAGKLKCETADLYWSMMTEIAAPVAAALSKAGDEVKEKIKREVAEAIHHQYPTDPFFLDSSALVIYGEK